MAESNNDSIKVKGNNKIDLISSATDVLVPTLEAALWTVTVSSSPARSPKAMIGEERLDFETRPPLAFLQCPPDPCSEKIMHEMKLMYLF
ncbi:hypothetical protein QVD17_19284 [Tagetes erecta]|uniref:Uncharacterized protein n=1 Tax=Tagetes erecta TaxID=13708 RepID=A0AAD8KJG3_TARER|nr:hypothetical protein QVD17_19284 [Tagetes erecta]